MLGVDKGLVVFRVTRENGSYYVEANSLFKTGRLKVFQTRGQGIDSQQDYEEDSSGPEIDPM